MKINDIKNQRLTDDDDEKDTLDYKVRTNKITGGGGSLDQIQQKFASIPVDMGPRKKEKKDTKKKDTKSKKPNVKGKKDVMRSQNRLPANVKGLSDNSSYIKDKEIWTWKKERSQWLSNKGDIKADQDGWREFVQAHKEGNANIVWENISESILNEGGNVFKKVDGDNVQPITQRIATADVDPTIDWLNKTFGFKFVDEDKLGTTGKKNKPDGTFEENSSGDIDLNVDVRELPKEEIIAKLTSWCQKQGIDDLEIMNKGRTFTQGWVANAGLQVHFRTPIRGDVKNGFVQTDFMLTDNPDLQRGAKRGGTENYTGADRAVLLSSLARGRGYKFSPTKGVVDPNNGDAVVANNWDEIAEILLGKGAKESDTHTVESMIAKLKSDPNFDELIAPWLENMEKQGKGLPQQAESLADKHLSRLKRLLP